MLDEIFGGVIPTIQQAMDVRVKRHKLIASNIANIETPGYKEVDIDFKATMKNLTGETSSIKQLSEDRVSLIKTNPSHFTIGAALDMGDDYVFESDGSETIPNDDNNVSIEKEITKLGDNSFQYELQANLLRQKYKMINYVISKMEK